MSKCLGFCLGSGSFPRQVQRQLGLALLIATAGCGGGTGPGHADTEPPPRPRPLLVLLGDTTTPTALDLARTLRAAGYTAWAPTDGGDDPQTLQDGIKDRCAASASCGALVLIGLGPRGAGRVDPWARTWQAGGDGPAGWRVRAVVTWGAGYTPPFRVMDGVWERTGLADTSRWGVGMIQSRDDPAAARCDATGCGVLPLAVAHGARGHAIVSACPPAGAAGEHRPTAEVPDWSAWLVAAVSTLLMRQGDVTLPVTSPSPAPLSTPLGVNDCLRDLEALRPSPPGPPPLR